MTKDTVTEILNGLLSLGLMLLAIVAIPYVFLTWICVTVITCVGSICIGIGVTIWAGCYTVYAFLTGKSAKINQLSREEFIEKYDEHLYCAAAETGADREADYSVERFQEEQYHQYLNRTGAYK